MLKSGGVEEGKFHDKLAKFLDLVGKKQLAFELHAIRNIDLSLLCSWMINKQRNRCAEHAEPQSVQAGRDGR